MIVLYNGRAGWAVADGRVGMCHVELAQAMSECPAKVFIIKLPVVASDAESAKRDARFHQYIETINPWCREAANGEAVLFRAKESTSSRLHQDGTPGRASLVKR